MEDTIVAISTPFGISGLGIVRLSGDKAINIAEKIFIPRNKNKVVSQLKTFTTHLGYIIDNGSVLDEVLMTIMRKPHSYTCEDVVEFSCHGGIVILKRLVELCIFHGARMAEPGEFTKRAFLNGRIDLSQAESVCELINAKTLLQNKLATYSILGTTRKNIESVVSELKDIIAEIEILLDYPEEDDVSLINLRNVYNRTKELHEKIHHMISHSERLIPIITGFSIAIVGKPNVGKSSLLNILLKHDRAIVSDIPGTTRDTISETINLNNVPVKIVDTAGIKTHSQDVVEQLGIERTKKAIEEANVILFLFDASTGLTYEDQTVFEIISSVDNTTTKIVLPVINKIDLCEEKKLKNLVTEIQKFLYQFFSNSKSIKIMDITEISCKTNSGISTLENTILSSVGIQPELEKQFSQDTEPYLFVTNLRQIELLKSALKELSSALEVNIETSLELFCEHLRFATKELLKITGGELTEDILDIIFSKFCVGK